MAEITCVVLHASSERQANVVLIDPYACCGKPASEKQQAICGKCRLSSAMWSLILKAILTMLQTSSRNMLTATLFNWRPPIRIKHEQLRGCNELDEYIKLLLLLDHVLLPLNPRELDQLSITTVLPICTIFIRCRVRQLRSANPARAVRPELLITYIRA